MLCQANYARPEMSQLAPPERRLSSPLLLSLALNSRSAPDKGVAGGPSQQADSLSLLLSLNTASWQHPPHCFLCRQNHWCQLVWPHIREGGWQPGRTLVRVNLLECEQGLRCVYSISPPSNTCIHLVIP